MQDMSRANINLISSHHTTSEGKTSLTHTTRLSVWKIRSLIRETSSYAKGGCLSIASQSTRRVEAKAHKGAELHVDNKQLQMADLAGAMHGDRPTASRNVAVTITRSNSI